MSVLTDLIIRARSPLFRNREEAEMDDGIGPPGGSDPANGGNQR